MKDEGLVPDEASLGSVDEVHAVRGVVLPANFIGIVPQSSDLKPTHADRYQRRRGNEYLMFPEPVFEVGLEAVYLFQQDIVCDLANKCLTYAWCLVFPVCHRALRRYSPGPVVELTSLIETPAVAKALKGFFSQ